MSMLPKIVFLDRATLSVPLRPVNLPHIWVDYPLTAVDEVAGRIADASVVVTNKVVIDEKLLSRAPQLKLIAVAATGYNIIDIAACQARGVRVCNIRDYAQTGVIEHTLMLILALRRQLLAYRAAVQTGAWQRSSQFYLAGPPLHDLAGSTLAIFGRGALGAGMAEAAQALGMQTLYADRKGASSVRPGYVAFDEALARADILSLHCPLNAETRGLIGAAELARMKPSALLINTARGGIVDEAALLAALQSGQIAGAGVDVLSEEPPRQGNPLLNADLPNLIVTPHVAWASVETVQKLAAQLIDNVEAFLQGQPRNVVV
ncbi:MAG: D-2-hydroxyacid dehydrogenase [Uliginosibacterium sp.]|nr:D-2-hydroxyacid dehydrogenase [Uliginosibacterium sp.]